MAIKALNGQSITIVGSTLMNKLWHILVAMTVGMIIGEQMAIYNIKQDCGYLEKFRIDKGVYLCKKTH